MKIWAILLILTTIVCIAGFFILAADRNGYAVSYQMAGFAAVYSFMLFALGWRMLRGRASYRNKKESDILDDL